MKWIALVFAAIAAGGLIFSSEQLTTVFFVIIVLAIAVISIRMTFVQRRAEKRADRAAKERNRALYGDDFYDLSEEEQQRRIRQVKEAEQAGHERCRAERQRKQELQKQQEEEQRRREKLWRTMREREEREHREREERERRECEFREAEKRRMAQWEQEQAKRHPACYPHQCANCPREARGLSCLMDRE